MSELTAIGIDSIIYAARLFLIAVGLTLIYGVMKILNLAHGSLYAIGAYMAATFVGFWLQNGHSVATSYLLLVGAAAVTGVILGPIIERGLLKFLYGKEPVVLLLVTYAVFLILEDVAKLIWGVDSYVISEPYGYLGNFSFGELVYPNYSWLVIGAAIIAGIVLTFILSSTKKGKLLRAVIHDQEVSKAVGINVDRYFLITFIAGAALAALGGALVAPTISVVPGMGVDVIVLAFAVVVIGGLGSVPGAALGALMVGVVRSLAIHYLPQVELFSIYAVMAFVLIFKPKGLFASEEGRKI